MEKHVPERQRFDVTQAFLYGVLVEQRASTEELKASSRELESILDEFLAMRADLRAVIEQMDAPGAEERPTGPRTSGSVEVLTTSRLKREAERAVRNAREAIRESLQLRARSRRLRTAMKRFDNKGDIIPAGRQSLSRRERQVLALIVAGKSSKEIAAELGISFKTAVTHRASIMGKLDVHEIASMVREAIRRGLVQP